MIENPGHRRSSKSQVAWLTAGEAAVLKLSTKDWMLDLAAFSSTRQILPRANQAWAYRASISEPTASMEHTSSVEHTESVVRLNLDFDC